MITLEIMWLPVQMTKYWPRLLCWGYKGLQHPALGGVSYWATSTLPCSQRLLTVDENLFTKNAALALLGSEISMQALGWISLAEQRAKAKKCLKFFIAWYQPGYQISLQKSTQSIAIIISEIQLKRLHFPLPKRDFLKKQSKLQRSQDFF